MRAKAAKVMINKGLTSVSDDTILILLKKTIQRVTKNKIKKIYIDVFA